MKRYGDFSIGDLVRLINTKIVGIIIGEERETERYNVEWLNRHSKNQYYEHSSMLLPPTSWACYSRLERV
jgi:hypothetical protein